MTTESSFELEIISFIVYDTPCCRLSILSTLIKKIFFETAHYTRLIKNNLSGKYNEPPDTDEPVFESEEFCAVFQTKLNNKNLLYGAEMDGIISDKELTGLF